VLIVHVNSIVTLQVLRGTRLAIFVISDDINPLMDFHQTFVKSVFCDREELLGFASKGLRGFHVGQGQHDRIC